MFLESYRINSKESASSDDDPGCMLHASAMLITIEHSVRTIAGSLRTAVLWRRVFLNPKPLHP